VLKAEVRFFHWVAKMADSRSRRPEQRAGTPAPPAGVEYQAFTVRRYLVHAINRACRASHSPACAPVTAERMACAGVGFVHLLAASPAARAVWTNQFADGPHIWRLRAEPVRSPVGTHRSAPCRRGGICRSSACAVARKRLTRAPCASHPTPRLAQAGSGSGSVEAAHTTVAYGDRLVPGCTLSTRSRRRCARPSSSTPTGSRGNQRTSS